MFPLAGQTAKGNAGPLELLLYISLLLKGVAEFRVENKTVDAYDFQQVHKVIPVGFFR